MLFPFLVRAFHVGATLAVARKNGTPARVGATLAVARAGQCTVFAEGAGKFVTPYRRATARGSDLSAAGGG